MISKIYLVTDLGPGDGGKGGIVHMLANTFHASLVLKFGGGQGSHGVVTNNGEKFAFSHWGCGTLEAIPTMITPEFVVIPIAILREGRELRRLGITNPYSLLTIDPRAVCATPLHEIASQLSELSLRDVPRGTIGTGAGQAYRMKSKLGESGTIRMQDLCDDATIKTKLSRIANYYREKFANFRIAELLPEDQSIAQELLDLLQSDDYFEWTLEQYHELAQTSLLLMTLEETLRLYDGLAVAECSHGVLTDAVKGFRPHVSAIRTLPEFAIQTLHEAGFTGKIVRLGITRAYAIRHGAGPLPTADVEMRKRLLPDSHKQINRWQGDVRVGSLDFKLLRYAVQACGGAEAFDGLCVTCFDQIMADGVWRYCENYELEIDSNTRESILNVCEIDCKKYPQQELLKKCCEVFWKNLRVPVKLIALGPSDQDKILF